MLSYKHNITPLKIPQQWEGDPKRESGKDGAVDHSGVVRGGGAIMRRGRCVVGGGGGEPDTNGVWRGGGGGSGDRGVPACVEVC